MSVTDMEGKELEDALNPVTEFRHALHPYPEFLKMISAQGFQNPSPIQCQLWPMLMSGQDVVGIAQTGTGKTLGFLLPALLHIDAQPYFREKARKGAPLCLIVAPTRELAQQIQEEAVKFRYKGIKSVCVYGQGDFNEQCSALKNGVEIVVATPGRLLDFEKRGMVDLRGISYLVLDEADRMLDLGFQPDIIKITFRIRPDRQTVLTSATWPSDVKYIANRIMNKPLKVRIGQLDLAAVASVTQTVQICENDDKIGLLLEVLRDLRPNDKVIVFSNKKAMVDHLVGVLCENDIDSRVMHGGLDQSDREQSLEDLKSGECRILLATDVASRGLDVSDLTLVINFDLPRNLEEYVHRAGRTGRAGKFGEVHSFVTWENRNQAQELVDIFVRNNQVPTLHGNFQMLDTQLKLYFPCNLGFHV
ncbi:UNVERIFIED_CONTAM: hypothetical protein GTU68_012725 [Idotea baltica]|nr:hypothetical protein [Idotea baltica]